jgi:hypothetical protein
MQLGQIEVAQEGVTTAIGSLPFRNATVAAEFALQATPMLPAIPTLPKRSPAEGMISQAVLGISGISLGQYGSIAIDTRAVDVHEHVSTDLGSDAFAGFREFLRVAQQEFSKPSAPKMVKWQFVGPISLGVALVRAGLDPQTAFSIAVRAVREHTSAMLDAVALALPGVQQVVLLDEPSFGMLSTDDSPIRLDHGVDMLSAALALVEQRAVAGVHCCGDPDWGLILDAGPSLVSFPVSADLSGHQARLANFVESGGVIAWGAVRTDGPQPLGPERAWRSLTARLCELVDAGADAGRLLDQCIVTPACGFGMHSEGSTLRGMEQLRALGSRVADGTASMQLALRS